ncbi:MAG: hypothetical protein JKY36_05670 [Erythrobacter sp.]|nr:hypothetical protein [Erythrobacter sp.]
MSIAERLIDRASVIFDVGPRDIRSPYRADHIAIARHAVCKVASELGVTMTDIGPALNRDRCTARDSRDRAAFLEKTDPEFAARLDALRREAMGEIA